MSGKLQSGKESIYLVPQKPALEFPEIYDSHRNLVYNLALQYVANVEDAEEITQDVFMAVYQSVEKFRFEAKISTWIYRITINKSLDFMKAKQRKKRTGIFLSLFGDTYQDEKEGFIQLNHPGIELESKEAYQRVYSVIQKLPDRQRTVLILNKFEQMSYTRIAEILEITPKAVDSLLQRAKQNLEIGLKNEGK